MVVWPRAQDVAYMGREEAANAVALLRLGMGGGNVEQHLRAMRARVAARRDSTWQFRTALEDLGEDHGCCADWGGGVLQFFDGALTVNCRSREAYVRRGGVRRRRWGGAQDWQLLRCITAWMVARQQVRKETRRQETRQEGRQETRQPTLAALVGSSGR